MRVSHEATKTTGRRTTGGLRPREKFVIRLPRRRRVPSKNVIQVAQSTTAVHRIKRLVLIVDGHAYVKVM